MTSGVESLHGTEPAEIFNSGLENIDQIEAVAVAVQWKNGAITTGWSNCDARVLAFMLMAIDEKFRRDYFRNI